MFKQNVQWHCGIPKQIQQHPKHQHTSKLDPKHPAFPETKWVHVEDSESTSPNGSVFDAGSERSAGSAGLRPQWTPRRSGAGTTPWCTNVHHSRTTGDSLGPESFLGTLRYVAGCGCPVRYKSQLHETMMKHVIHLHCPSSAPTNSEKVIY